jgi:cytochrome P450
LFGRLVVVADPQLAKELFTANPDDVGNIQPNLSRVLGSGSVFALDGAEHRKRRRLLTPPFHGRSIKNYEKIFEEETLRETANWPEEQAFPTLEPMMRITLNAILRAVFGAEGDQLDELRRIIPPWVTLGSRLALLPAPSRTYGRFSPWGRLADYRRRYDEVIDRLIQQLSAGPNFETREDILSLLLRSTYEDGSSMSPRDIADELLTLLAAGHETTASTMGWIFERISRHPTVLERLVAEADTDENQYRQATILETQRVRTVIDFAPRRVYATDFTLGDWTIPQGYSVVASLVQMHESADAFPTRSGSTRTGSTASVRRHSHGFRTVAVRGAASVRCSRMWRWMWCFEPYCATSPSTRRPHQTKWCTPGALHIRPRTAAEW